MADLGFDLRRWGWEGGGSWTLSTGRRGEKGGGRKSLKVLNV